MNEDAKNHTGAGLRIFRNFGYLTIGKLLADGGTFLFFLVLARTFGQEGIGQYSFAMALTGVLSVFADFGIRTLSIKNLSRDRDQVATYYGRLLAVRLLLSVMVISVLLVMAALFPFSDEMKLLIVLIGAYQVFLTLVEGFGAVFVAWEDMHITSLFEVSLRVSTALAGMVIVYCGGSLLLAVSSLPAMTLLHVALGYHLILRRCGALRIFVRTAGLRQVFGEAFPYALYSLLDLFSSRVALLFVGFMLSAAATGVFNVAYRFVVVLLFMPVFAGLAILPIASRLYLNSLEQLQELYRTTLNVAIVLSLPMAGGIWLIAPRLIEFLYGLEFAESIVILRWLAWLVPVVFLRCIMRVFLIASDRQEAVTRSQFLVACVGGILHYWLIGKYGLQGAAAATLLAELLLIGLLGYQLKAFFVWQNVGIRIVIGSTAVATFLLPLVTWNSLPLSVTILCAVLIYSGVLFLFSDIRQEEFRLLLNYLSHHRQIQSGQFKNQATKTAQI